jgi:prepilin-type N-terminal cleavage/methylation domain-containing protein
MSRRYLQRQAGFTIIELLIATAVFSMVIILISVGVLSFTKAYYKGVNQSNTQNAARLIIEDIAQSIQFSGGEVQPVLGTVGSGDSTGFCVGSSRYSYVLGKQLSDDVPLATGQTKHALVVDKGASCAGGNAQDVEGSSVAGTELLTPRMRLSKLTIEPVAGTTDVFKITIRIVYGDDDLITNPTADNAFCSVGISGGQYCAQAELSTVVKKRIGQ